MNCALGGEQMRPYIAELGEAAPTPTSACYPNAGLPNPLSPTGFPKAPKTPRPSSRPSPATGLAQRRRRLLRHHARPYRRHPPPHGEIPARASPEAVVPALSSGLEALNIIGGPGTFVNVGERTNVTGSSGLRKARPQGRLRAPR
jgi:5-methyltetrahydrofolate--homocysteine methyltransferase